MMGLSSSALTIVVLCAVSALITLTLAPLGKYAKDRSRDTRRDRRVAVGGWVYTHKHDNDTEASDDP
jgi:hypothetical protein